jgi:hypothetical protein
MRVSGAVTDPRGKRTSTNAVADTRSCERRTRCEAPHRSEFFMTIFGLVTVLYRTSVYTRNPILFRDTHLTRQYNDSARGVRFTAASVSTRIIASPTHKRPSAAALRPTDGKLRGSPTRWFRSPRLADRLAESCLCFLRGRRTSISHKPHRGVAPDRLAGSCLCLPTLRERRAPYPCRRLARLRPSRPHWPRGRSEHGSVSGGGRLRTWSDAAPLLSWTPIGCWRMPRAAAG